MSFYKLLLGTPLVLDDLLLFDKQIHDSMKWMLYGHVDLRSFAD